MSKSIENCALTGMSLLKPGTDRGMTMEIRLDRDFYESTKSHPNQKWWARVMQDGADHDKFTVVLERHRSKKHQSSNRGNSFNPYQSIGLRDLCVTSSFREESVPGLHAVFERYRHYGMSATTVRWEETTKSIIVDIPAIREDVIEKAPAARTQRVQQRTLHTPEVSNVVHLPAPAPTSKLKATDHAWLKKTVAELNELRDMSDGEIKFSLDIETGHVHVDLNAIVMVPERRTTRLV